MILPTTDQLARIYVSECALCKAEYFRGYRGFWCQPACYRLNQCLTREMFMNRELPDRKRLEAIYGEDTPEFSY